MSDQAAQTLQLQGAYHGDPAIKAGVLAQLAEHRRLDQIVQGTYWTDDRGCAVGCLTHDPSGGHESFPERWGVPVQLAHLIDVLFEALPLEQARDWPLRIMEAIPVGADLSRVWDGWCTWMLGDLVARAVVSHDPCVDVMRGLFERAAAGDEPRETEWAWVAGAAWVAWVAEAAEAARAEAADELIRLVQR